MKIPFVIVEGNHAPGPERDEDSPKRLGADASARATAQFSDVVFRRTSRLGGISDDPEIAR
jgi:hypothetical protein